MPARAISSHTSPVPFDRLCRAQEILRQEAAALTTLAEDLSGHFDTASKLIEACAGCVVVTGIGKAGIVGQKLAASLSSTGTPSHFLHPSEAVHGDLGCVRSQDVVVLMSYSGETEEVIRLIPSLNATASATIAITAHNESTLARSVDVVLPVGKHPEACNLGLAPSTSTTLMIAVSDALALVASESRCFSQEQFAQFHPGGSLGRQLSLVLDVMRPKEQCRLAEQHRTVREVLVRISRPGRRTGAIMLTDEAGKLSGIFTDSDLARLLERQQDNQLDAPIQDLMTTKFHTVIGTSRFSEAVRIMSDYKISELPVVDSQGYPLGIVDITDVVGVQAEEPTSPPPRILAMPNRT